MDGFVARYRTVVLIAATGIVAVTAAFVLWPMLPALLWATVLAVLAEPMYARLRKRFSPNMSALFATLLTLLVIGVPLLLVGTVLYVQLSAFAREMANSAPAGQNAFTIDNLAKRLDHAMGPILSSIAPGFSIADYLQENRGDLARSLTVPAGVLARHLFQSLVTMLVAFLTLFFLLRDCARMKAPFKALFPVPNEQLDKLLARQVDTIRGVFIGVLFVAIIQGGLAMLAYVITGVPSAFMWGLLTMVLCTLPMLGAPAVYIPLSILLIIQGNTFGGIALFIIGVAFLSQIDNIIRPFIIGTRIDLHPMAIFFALLGGAIAIGPIGLFVGPMVLAAAASLMDYASARLTEKLAPSSA